MATKTTHTEHRETEAHAKGSGKGDHAPEARNATASTRSERHESGHDEANPKLDPHPGSNAEKDPDDWTTGGEPMTGAQASYLKTLAEQAKDDEAFSADLTKAEASKRIDALKGKTGH